MWQKQWLTVVAEIVQMICWNGKVQNTLCVDEVWWLGKISAFERTVFVPKHVKLRSRTVQFPSKQYCTHAVGACQLNCTYNAATMKDDVRPYKTM
jgi:hypothetical protein